MSIEALSGVNFSAADQPEMNADLRVGESGDTVRISDDDLKAGVDQMMRISCAVAVS